MMHFSRLLTDRAYPYARVHVLVIFYVGTYPCTYYTVEDALGAQPEYTCSRSAQVYFTAAAHIQRAFEKTRV
eukprot:1344051-Amorphochlora_amoeboformis.AAC.1